MQLNQEFLTDLKLSPSNKVVYVGMCLHSTENGYVDISDIEQFSEDIGVSRATFMSSMRRLEELNYIKRIYHFNENSKKIAKREITILQRS